MSDDPQIAEFVRELEKLGKSYSADTLRESKREQTDARKEAEAILSKLSGYKL